MYEFKYHRPATVRQAANLLIKNEDAKVIAGGHTLLPVMKQRLASPPHLVDGRAEVCQLVAINLTDINVKGSWFGPGRLHLVPHVNAPVADFPVRRVIGAHHFLADLTLPYGRVVNDYNKQTDELAEAAE